MAKVHVTVTGLERAGRTIKKKKDETALFVNKIYPAWYLLTYREKQVTALVCDNFGTKEIAAKLILSPETVKSHVCHILNKFNVHTRLDLQNILEEYSSSGRLKRYINISPDAGLDSAPLSEKANVRWEYEDQLPESLPDDVFSSMYKASIIDDGVRIYPYIEADGRRFFIVDID